MAEPVLVRLLGREMVVPSKPTKHDNFFLSGLDLFWLDTHYNRRLIFYESATGWLTEDGRPGVPGQESSDGRAAVMAKLKSSLALCLVHYYCLCGRIAKGREPDHRLFIDCNDAGVEFVEAYVDLPIYRLAKDSYQIKPLFQEICQLPDHRGDCLYSSPLLSIQATFFSDGGLAIGIAQSHVVADGLSLWSFMVSWGECSRGIPLSLPPLHSRERLAVPVPSPEKAMWSLRNLQIKEEDKVREEMEEVSVLDKGDASIHNDKDKNGSVGMDPSTTESSMETKASLGDNKVDPLVQCMFNLPSSAIKELKSEAGEGYTSFEVICAHFWQRVTTARETPPHEPTRFRFTVNCRTRMTPPLPPAYFGNVVAFGQIWSTVGIICRETLHATACRIHDESAKIKKDYIFSLMHRLETHKNNPSGSVSTPLGKGLIVASSPWFPAYQVDFGWGKPVAIRTVEVYKDGEIVLFGGRPGCIQGDVEICTALRESVLRRLLEDPVFLATAPCSPFATDL